MMLIDIVPWTLVFLLRLSPASAQTYYTKPCPLLGLSYPPLTSYASSDVFQSALTALNNSFTQALNQSTPYGQLASDSNAFSIDIYSLHDEESLLSFDYTPQALVAQHSVGVLNVNSDTVYRIGSITKMLTVYIYLIAAGDSTWNDPVTKYVPELAAYAAMHQEQLKDNTIDYVDWDSITVGALASQLSGIAREVVYSPAGEEALQQIFSLPAPIRNENASCGIGTSIQTPCNRSAFFDDFLRQHPFTAPFTTPIYSNVGFQILGYAIENITGTSFADLFNQTLVQQLGLTSTSYSVPSSPDQSIVPINTTASLWEFDARGEGPTGGSFSSVSDFRKIGKSILNSTLISPAQTRRWLKPHAFTADTNFSIGAPWEIVRAPGDPVTYIYSKTGAFGLYGGIIALIPDYNIGITVFSAGFSPTDAARILSDLAVDSLVPALYNATQSAAISSYAGTYTNTTANSSITISAPDAGPGLTVSAFTLNGTDFISTFGSVLGINATTMALNVTLYPSGLTSNNRTVVSWRASWRVSPQILDPGVFSDNCVTWGAVNTVTYDGVGFDEFLFTLDGSGMAVAIEPRLFGQSLRRGNGSSLRRVG